jgi:secondary thiamine-phosphate synthase enzyme
MQITIEIKTTKKQEIVDITEQVRDIAKKSDVDEGICLIYTPHTTCAIIVNENSDKSVCEDVLTTLDKIIPMHDDYKHDKIDNNAAAHIKATILGPSQSLSVHNGILQLGQWQGIALAEFDGPRDRKVYVNMLMQ